MKPKQAILAIILCALFAYLNLVHKTTIPTNPTRGGNTGSVLHTNQPISGTIGTNVSQPNPKHLSFVETMQRFPWEKLIAALEDINASSVAEDYVTDLSLQLYPFLLRAPPTPANQSCKPPPLDYSALIHKCEELDSPRRVGVLLTFSFDVDALEIHLHELNAVVDIFFLIESVKPHNRMVKWKPLVWEQVKREPRFLPFAKKVVHFKVKQGQVSNTTEMWDNEHHERKRLWRMFLKWNKKYRIFQGRDLLGFGDPDEIPNRDNIAFLKNCQLPSDPIDIGIWFPMGGLDTIFRTDHPVDKDHPYTFGNPTYGSLGVASLFALKTGRAPEKSFGKSKAYLLGGMHLSTYPFPPYDMMKALTCSSCQRMWRFNLLKVIHSGMLYRAGNITAATTHLFKWRDGFENRYLNLTKFQEKCPGEAEKVVKVPWYLQCNWDRYPSFKNEWDPRLN